MVRLVDGKAVAARVYANLRGERPLTLGILIVGSDTVTDAFVRAKERAAAGIGVTVLRASVPETASTNQVIAALNELSADVDGLIVQLPLPSNVDTDAVLGALPPEKDVDGISPHPLVRPPVAEAVNEIVRESGVATKGLRAVVVGAGRLVGQPAARLLETLECTVTVLQKGDSLDSLSDADIIVSGAGQPGMITPEHVKPGAIIIDAGTSESSGKVVGDADPRCAEKCSIFTPVPGGVGPIAVAMIFKNLFELANRS